MLVVICFISVWAGKYLYEKDNSDTKAKEFYVDDDTLVKLIYEWKTKSILAIALVIIFFLLIVVVAYCFIATASLLSLMFFSIFVMLFEVCNKHVFKRYKILSKLADSN